MSGIYWLASYPKSGNTWLRILLTNYLRDANEPADINELDVGVGVLRKFFDDTVGIDSEDLPVKQIEYYRPLVYEKMAAENSEPLFLKVHDAYNFNADGKPIFSKKATAGVIYLIRNPLDVVVSYAHHNDRQIDKTIRFMANDKATLGGEAKQLKQLTLSWKGHVSSWTDKPDLHIHIVRYEDMIADTVAAFAKIVKFAGLEFDKDRIKKAVEFSDFKKLKKQETTHGFAEKPVSAASFFRQGKSGSWRDFLTEDQIARIISDNREVMRRFGYLNSEDEVVY